MVNTKTESIISAFIRNNYKTFDETTIGTVISGSKAETRLCIKCRDCKTVVHIKTLDSLNISVETYTMAIIRRALEKHIVECDGTYRPPVRQYPKAESVNLRTRKIELD